MKKAIALLLVLAVALGMSTAVFAATDYPGIDPTAAGEAGTAFGETDTTAADDADAGFIYIDETNNPSVFSIRDEDPDNPGATVVTVPDNELYLVDTDNGVVVGMNEILLPNSTYKFYVYHNDSEGDLEGTDAEVISGGSLLTRQAIGSTGSVKFRTVRGSSAIQSTKVRTKGSGINQTYYVEISTRNVYGTKISDVEYNLSATISGTRYDDTLEAVPVASLNTFQVGFMSISDDETDVGEEGTIVIYRETPVVLKDQFSDIARSANYKNVFFEGEEGTWSFKGKVAGMKDSNFYYDFEPDTDLLNKFPEHEFKFLSFRAGVNFPTTGEMRIDVSDVSGDFNSMYAYLYRDGKLTEINSTYDSATDELVFRTNYLGNFIITNRAITDTSLLADYEPEEDIEDEEEEYNNYPNNTNPATGAPASANAMVAFGLVTLVSAAAIGRKRK